MAGNEESISVEEILELASVYIDIDEYATILNPKDLFALLVRPISAKKNSEWFLASYGLLSDYVTDVSEKPYGKWITMKYLSFDTFPPRQAEIRLQPPHIVKGYFQSFDRSSETKIVAVMPLVKEIEKKNPDGEEAVILRFPTEKKE
jgi:hypothetical protein